MCADDIIVWRTNATNVLGFTFCVEFFGIEENIKNSAFLSLTASLQCFPLSL